MDDSIKLILANLKESIKLWVRMGTDEGFKKPVRKKMRMSVKFLIGENLQVLSKLQGVSLEKYRDLVLPGVIEIVSPKNFSDFLSSRLIRIAWLSNMLSMSLFKSTPTPTTWPHLKNYWMHALVK